jgi:hypothetical protein
MKMAIKRYKFERLNEDNYKIWASRAKALFRQRNLWETSDPGYVVPLGGRLTNSQQNNDDDAKNLLIQLVDNQFLRDVEKCQRSMECPGSHLLRYGNAANSHMHGRIVYSQEEV